MKRKKQFIKLYHYYKYSIEENNNKYAKFMNSINLNCKCYSQKYIHYIALYQKNTINKILRMERIKYKLSKYI
jgi:hypothetical protein